MILMQAFFQKIASFFLAILLFFGIVKAPAQPAQPTQPEVPDPPMQQTAKYIAHRGATFAAPENTLLAFEKAVADGCDGVELDVRQTQDGVLVLSHNAAVRGMLNGEETSRKISENTYESLCELSLGEDETGAEIHVPTLSQALELLRSLGLEAMVHCKLQSGVFLQQVAQTVRACGMSGRCAYNTDKDFAVTIPTVLNEDPSAVFHVPYDNLLADESIRALVSDPKAIIATVNAAALSDRIVSDIREKGFSSYIWNVTAETLETALNAAPDYIEFVSGVRVTELLNAV